MKSIIKLIFIFLIQLPILSCEPNPSKDLEEIKKEASTVESNIVSLTPIKDVTSTDLREVATAAGFEILKPKMNYDVSIYKLEYKTTFNGSKITASGMVYLPKGSDVALPILSAQHGTTFKKSDAPSASYGISQEVFAASAGYITLAPDYIGYGSSSQIFHPYYDRYHSGLAVRDMLVAGKEVLNQKGIKHNSKLFLLGYSEGGYVTLAAQKMLEENPVADINLIGVAAGAGGYDLNAMLQNVTTTNYYSYPAYLAFIMQSFNLTYNWNKSLNYFFQQKYADRLNQYLDGSYSGGFINGQLTTRIDSLLDNSFLLNVKGSGEKEFKDALIKNSFSDWNPKTSLRLYHGTSDEIIPIENSKNTYLAFKYAGSDVEFFPIQGGTHGSSLLPMVKLAIPWFEQLNTNNK
jgi:pimeloyl-ACP methyl ester carboxylesterase